MTDAPAYDLWRIELTYKSIRDLCQQVGFNRINQIAAIQLIVEDIVRRYDDTTVSAGGLRQMVFDPVLRKCLCASERDIYSKPALETCEEFIRRLEAHPNLEVPQ